MADLPVELWHSIFNHLELIDLSSCALVCRALYSAVKAYPMQEIAFDGRVYDWFYSDFSIYQHSVDYSMASLLSRSSFNLEHLKRLKIDRCSTIYDLNRINKLVNLEDLVIDLANYKNEQSKTLSLAHLKVLRLCMSEHLPYLELDTPSLAKVYTFSLEKLEFLYPDSVRCIRTLLHVEKLSMFRNLECLLFTTHYNQLDYSESYASQSFNEFNLTALKKLKEIEFRFNSCNFETNNWSKIQKIIRNILALERPDLKVFWYGVQVTDTYLLTDYEEIMDTSEGLTTFQLKHSKKLKDKVDYIWMFDFNESMRRLTEDGFELKSEEFTSNLFAKYSFTGIEVTGEVKHPELLLELIAKSPGLWSLRFSDTDLDQSFFDRMANTIQMNRIPLKQLLFNNHSSLNFDFVLKLCHLKVFDIDQQIPNELISKMLKLGRPTEICHRFRSGFGERIERLSTNKFLRNDEPISLQELLSECDCESDSGSDLGSGSGSDSETGSESDSETDSGSDSETDSGSDSESSESYSETDSDSDSETQCVLM